MDRLIWRVLVPAFFAWCIVLTIGAALDRSRLVTPDGFLSDAVLSDSVPDSTHVASVVPGSEAARSGMRAGDLVSYEGLSWGQRALPTVGDLRRVLDVRTGKVETLRLRPDPNVWTTAKHYAFAVVTVLELSGLAILLLRPNLVLARALAAAVILPSVGGLSYSAHWTGSEGIAFATFLLQRALQSIGVASLGFVALGLSKSVGVKWRLLAYAPIALGAVLAVVTTVRRAEYLVTGMARFLPAAGHLLNLAFALMLALGFAAVVTVAFQTRGLERRRAMIVAFSLILGNISAFSVAIHSHFISGPEQIVENVGLLLEAAGLAYAVFVDRLFDVGFVLNRAVVAGGVTALLLPAFVGIEWATQKLVESSGRVEGAAFSLALTIAIALSVRRVHALVDRAVDSVLFASRHRAANAVRCFANELALFRERDAFIGALVDTLMTFTRVAGCEVLLADTDDDLIAADARNLSVRRIGADEPLTIRLKSSRTWIDRATFPLLVQADLAFPMIVRGRLLGALLCTLPRHAEPLSPEEFDAIAHLMREAGATLVAMDASDAQRLRDENLALQAQLALRT